MMFKTLATLLAGRTSLARCLAELGVFDDKLDEEGKRRLFKSLVNYVEFGPHAFSNRTCRKNAHPCVC